MNLDEQLAFATQSVPQPVQQNVPTQQVQQPVQAPVNNSVTTQMPNTMPTDNVSQQPTTQNLQVPAQGQPQGLDLDAAQQEAEVTYAVDTIDFGKKISTRSIEPFARLEPGEKCRVTILGAPFYVKIHTHADLGKILCWSSPSYQGQCCRDMDDPKVRYCIPVLVYATMPGDPRTPLPQGKSELRLMNLWNIEAWDGLTEEMIDKGLIVNGKVDYNALANVDFIVTGEGTYADVRFKATNDSFRSQYQEAVNNAITAWSNIGPQKAMTTVGRKLNDERYLKLTQNAVPPKLQEYNMNDVMN